MIRLLMLCVIISSILSAQSISDLLPDTSGNWKKSGSPEIYRGDSLFKLIDGGAVLYNEYGFTQVIVQRYNDNDENLVDVEIYEMRDSSSAYGIFSLSTLYTGSPVDLNSEAYGGEEFILLWKGKYFISLSVLNSSEHAREGLLEIAGDINSGIASSGKPLMVRTFDDFTNSRIVYLKGNLGLSNIGSIQFGKEFNFDEGIYFEDEISKRYIFKYKEEEACKKNYNLLQENLKESNVSISLKMNYLIAVLSDNKTETDKTTEELLKNIKN